jgi:hypothetical protein
MNCDVFSILCLRANGQFSCSCDTGHEINLAAASADHGWKVTDVFGGRGYALARAMFRRGFAPWGETCKRCVSLQPNEVFAHHRPTKCLRQVLFEPSFACALRCPSCPRAELAPTRAGSVFLSVDIWRRVLRSLRDEGYSVGSFLSTGLGDPLTHPQIEDLIESIREFFPTSPITINTNGNYVFGEVFARGAYPDRLLVSIDGLHQLSYEKYRVKGRVALALDFMKDARRVVVCRPAVEWKYILFCHNDSDDELVATQRKAAEIDVDSLQFTFTHTREKSLTYTPANVDNLPILWSGTYPDATCHLRFTRTEANAQTPNDSGAQPQYPALRDVRIHVDSCHGWKNCVIVRGWAMGKDGSSPRHITIELDRGMKTAARIGLVREDVWHANPELGNRTAGFDAMFALNPGWSASRAHLTIVYESFDGVIHWFAVDYDLNRLPQPRRLRKPGQQTSDPSCVAG